MSAAVEFSGVSKRFGAVTAISGISFSVAAGETIALLGPSGCGKTTILRMIAGFEQPNDGSITIGGRDMRGLKPYERNVGLLFQHYALFPHMTVAENVAYGLRHRGAPSKSIAPRVKEMLQLVRMSEYSDRRPDRLSGGQQQRVALARALATQPTLLLLDEPLSALDAKLRHDLRNELKQMLAAVGSTVIVVTHDQEEAMSLGERIFVMNRGLVMQIGAPNEVYWRPRSRFVADFMGRTNWLEGRVVSGPDGRAQFETTSGWRMALEASTTPSGPASLCVRPESVEIGPHSEPPPGAASGQIVEVVPLGPIRQVVIELSGGVRVVAAQSNRVGDAPLAGARVSVSIAPEAGVLFPVPQQ
jgi:putative spermidine/putrescine transport system ATP-binding protein/putrescine transport system ATP-binding protein